MRCLNRPDGLGCEQCAFAAGSGIPPAQIHGNCACEVCQCNCSLLFYRNQRGAIANRTQEERLGVLNMHKKPARSAARK
jgi:hypothetical protein